MTFELNSASSGGAVYIECKNINPNNTCTNLFKNIIFKNNNAKVKGGAVYYDSYRPVFENIVYINNSAIYGSDIASYPVKIILQGSSLNDINLTDVGSGIKFQRNLTLSLVDYDNQEISNDNTSQIKLNGITNGSKILGFDSAKVDKGVGVFNNLIFIHSPGKTDVEFQANSKIIDSTLINKVFGHQFSNNTIYVSFRWCKPGEVQIGKDICNKCSQGTYSFLWNSTECQKCMNNAV